MSYWEAWEEILRDLWYIVPPLTAVITVMATLVLAALILNRQGNSQIRWWVWVGLILLGPTGFLFGSLPWLIIIDK